MADRGTKVTVRLTEQQRVLALRKMAQDRLTWQYLMSCAVSDYIIGEWEPTERDPLKGAERKRAWEVWGDTGFDPDDGLPALIEDGDDDVIDLEDLDDERFDWRVPQLKSWLEAELDQKITTASLYTMLKRHISKKPGQYQWKFTGPEDEDVIAIMELIEDGELERIRNERLQQLMEYKQKPLTEQKKREVQRKRREKARKRRAG